jgi:hypothetical protein
MYLNRCPSETLCESKEGSVAYVLGIKPDTLKVFLYRDADFDSVLTRQDEDGLDIPWGSSDVRLLFPDADPETETEEWDATVDEADATFQVDKAITNERSHGDRVELWVGDQCWAAGKVTKKGVL